jgi:two-component SAPR family response regulator
MRPLIETAQGYLSAQAISRWKKTIDSLVESHQRTVRSSGDERITLSMLGTISARMPDETVYRFQGARTRMVLAMMVINGMLKEPLSSAEFCRLAAGGDAIDIENARDVVKSTVHRIRETIGRDAVLTDGQTPHLNSRRVRVDLLDAHHLLMQATEAVRHSSPMQAKSLLLDALDITHGEVPFPSLYDELVEAVREDVENTIRTTAMIVAQALAREGGSDEAAQVLRHAVDALPGDEELVELLRDLLADSGHRVEAERMRRKLVEASG